MEAAEAWKHCFRNWPADLERHGVLVTSFNEQIPFDGFLVSEQLLLIERRTPDTLGARKVLLTYDNILAIKLTEVVKNKSFQGLGFEEAATRK